LKKPLKSFVNEADIPLLEEFLFSLSYPDTPIILHNDILLSFQKHTEEKGYNSNLTTVWRFLRKVQEILRLEDKLVIVYRHRRASCRFYLLTKGEAILHALETRPFLAIKERLINPQLPYDQRTLEIDFGSFYDYGPALRDPDTIGNGIHHLNQYMSTRLSTQPDRWNQALYEFLKLHQLHGMQLLLDGNKIRSTADLEGALEDAVDFLERCDCPNDQARIKAELDSIGFLAGWGNSAARILETMQLLQDILEQPNGAALEEFLSRIPMVSKVALISPHGWFGQKNVLGRPDTGGQVVYILDQAKALENYLAKDLKLAGLTIAPRVIIVTRLIPQNEGTSSDQRLEKVERTKNVWILRVPFRDHEGEIVPHWISRFRIWPYLDQFAAEVEKQLLEELKGLPDLIIGNYSDGNLVATRLSRNLGVIQGNIAHALEKSKYLFSDLHWQNFEHDYNFSVQFMADLIAMNLGNFIVTSTRQEITGSDTSIGQYESYQFFTMPGLINVVSGINLFHPRINVIPPGVGSDIFFPYTDRKRRKKKPSEKLAALIFETSDEDSRGRLENSKLPVIFSIARLDRIKNLTGLVEAYGRTPRLREVCNLVIVASTLHADRSSDQEEAEEIRRMHYLMDEYDLDGSMRWIGKFLSKEDTGEVYRIMSDRRGIFVQPALFEAFGLTILEAMHSGLPVFATKFGGPQEIIESGKSGFLINPTDQESMVEAICEFMELSIKERRYWQRFSEMGMKRARQHFTWDLHCQRLTRLTKVYGFWKYSISNEAKARMVNYCELLYHLFFKVRAENLR
jgi:sucrose synthase